MFDLAHPRFAPALEVLGPTLAGSDEVLTPGALAFVAALAAEFGSPLRQLLGRRAEVQERFDHGESPAFLASTRSIRESDWTVAPIPADLRDRRVEITGPVDRKMVINALNSGANVYMADFEDATAPTWANIVQGQANLREAVRGTISFHDRVRGRAYRLGEHTATMMVRPRGLHLPERHLRFEGEPVPGALVDFGLYLYHNVPVLLARGTGPYFYLPKLQSHLEARWWNEVFLFAQDALGLPRGTIRATVLIETLPAAFEMDEILHELRDHAGGLNCGRWDYIFSIIKTMREHPDWVLPDRSQIVMTQPCMRAYTRLVVKTCHRRRIHAMGGMAAQIPIKDDPVANRRALQRVQADKEREVGDGHDGTWVAHPGLVPLARQVFDANMSGDNQIGRRLDDVEVTAADLLQIPGGTRTEEGLRHNVRVAIRYLESWLRGYGCVPLYGLMEDAATAEISRAQIWQWAHHRATLTDGATVTPALVTAVADDEIDVVRGEVGDVPFRRGRFAEARRLFERLATAGHLEDFLTISAYRQLPSDPGNEPD